VALSQVVRLKSYELMRAGDTEIISIEDMDISHVQLYCSLPFMVLHTILNARSGKVRLLVVFL